MAKCILISSNQVNQFLFTIVHQTSLLFLVTNTKCCISQSSDES